MKMEAMGRYDMRRAFATYIRFKSLKKKCHVLFIIIINVGLRSISEVIWLNESVSHERNISSYLTCAQAKEFEAMLLNCTIWKEPHSYWEGRRTLNKVENLVLMSWR